MMPIKYRKLIPFVAVLLTFHQFFVLDVYAYIDPVTGSALLTLLAGVVAAGALILKSYWFTYEQNILDRLIQDFVMYTYRNHCFGQTDKLL